jgi:chromosomal replication initiator protein
MHAWEEFLKLQTAQLGKEVVAQWLRPLKALRFDACNLYLEASDAFQQLWFEEHIRPQLKESFRNPNGTSIKVHLSVANQPEGGKDERKKSPSASSQNQTFELLFDQPDPMCTLDRLVPQSVNPLPYKLLSEICHSATATGNNSVTPLGTFNPIYLYGGHGTGKSHLLTAVTHALRDAGLQALYVRAETFMEHVIKSIRAGEMHTFRKAYRSVEVLAFDDVHLLARKGATQEELFHTFNTLHTMGKQILFSAACAPGELQYIEPRLISRFEWGIVLEMLPLEGKEYADLLHSKCQALNFPLSTRLVHFLLETFPNNAKSLVRALEALVLRTHLAPIDGASLSITVLQAREFLADLIREEQHAQLTADKILRQVAQQYGIKITDILGKAQSRDCSLPRQLAAYLCREMLKMPYKQIGDLFGRDHSTIMTCIKQIKKHITTENTNVTSALRQIQIALQRTPQLFPVALEAET